MGYEFDVFLSYRRHKEWPAWVRRCFLPTLDHWLGEELGRDARIFHDEGIETGTKWPTKLGRALARSRVAVPLLSRQYFASDWCVLEFSQMCARGELCEIDPTESLLVPALIHDGDDLPAYAREITWKELADFADPWLAEGSPTWELLSKAIRDWVPDVAAAVRRAPDWDPQWDDLATEKFVAQFKVPEPAQHAVPNVGDVAA